MFSILGWLLRPDSEGLVTAYSARVVALLPLLVACGSAVQAVPAADAPVAAAPLGQLPSAAHPARGDQPVAVADLVPPLLEAEHYTDKFTFEFTLDSGHEVYFSVFVTNLGAGQHKARVNSRVVTPDGRRLKDEQRFDGGRWASARDRLDLRLGEYRLSGTPERLSLSTRTDDYAFDLVATPDPAAWRPRQGTLTLPKNPDAFFNTVYVAPRSRAEGSVTVGGAPAPVKGFGYGIHSVSNCAPYELAWRWLSFRSVDPGYTVFFRQVITPQAGGRREIAWLVVDGPGGLRFSSDQVTVTASEVTPDPHPNAYPVPGRLVLHARSGQDELYLLLRADELRSRDEPLKSLNAIVRAVAERVTQPLNLEYYAPFVARLRVNGVEREFDGRGNFELSFLNK
jgi:hypothetical protein